MAIVVVVILLVLSLSFINSGFLPGLVVTAIAILTLLNSNNRYAPFGHVSEWFLAVCNVAAIYHLAHVLHG
jgi:hypothetical protein